MTSAVISDIHEIRELSIDELGEAGGGLSATGWVVVGVAAGFVLGLGVGGGIALLVL